jgi:uncharacterized membrane protein YeaQ/YmgE (transglycosylase-associated protein family)
MIISLEKIVSYYFDVTGFDIIFKKKSVMSTLLLASIADKLQGQVQYYTVHWQALLLLIFVGAVAGMLAEFLVGSKGFHMAITILLGIVGSWVGNILFRHYLAFTSNDLINTIICATAGAMILVAVLSLVFRLRQRDRSNYKA